MPRWLELPPVPPQAAGQLTAVRWVARCCPGLPNSLLHRLFRKRQIRVRTGCKAQRVGEKQAMAGGEVICLPSSLVNSSSSSSLAREKMVKEAGAEEVAYLRSLVLYKDEGVIVVNKPAGMAVQGGTKVSCSLDSVMESALSWDAAEGPRLVHRLDKEASGVLVLARSRESAALLHSLFRDKAIERRYWALVLGCPSRPSGRIDAPLARVVVGDGGSDRILVADKGPGRGGVRHLNAVTEYSVLGTSVAGCTWLELRPLTGRKHQLRVHCAQALGTPIVGDFKYGWRAHKERYEGMGGSVLGSTPRLHLHCRFTDIPDWAPLPFDKESERMRNFVAPLPPHMQASWELKPPHLLTNI